MLSDPNFLRDFLGGIPGVDVDDEEIQKALRDLVEVWYSRVGCYVCLC